MTGKHNLPAEKQMQELLRELHLVEKPILHPYILGKSLK